MEKVAKVGKADALYLLYLVSAWFTRCVHQNHLRSFSKHTCLAYTFANLTQPPILISKSRVGPSMHRMKMLPRWFSCASLITNHRSKPTLLEPTLKWISLGLRWEWEEEDRWKISEFIDKQRSTSCRKLEDEYIPAFWHYSCPLPPFYKEFLFQGAKTASFRVRSLDFPSKAIVSIESLLSLRYLPPMVLSWYSWNCPLTKRNTRLDFPTADSPSRTNLNWHILLAWGCPLGLAVLLLVMARL